MPTAIRGSTPLYVWLVIIFADLKRSTPPIKPTTEVSLRSATNSLTKGGSIFL